MGPAARESRGAFCKKIPQKSFFEKFHLQFYHTNVLGPQAIYEDADLDKKYDNFLNKEGQ